MSKNILELLKDQINAYEQKYDKLQIEITRSLISKKSQFAFGLADYLALYALIESEDGKSYKERFAIILPTLKLTHEKRRDILNSKQFSNPIEKDEFLLKLFLDPYNIWEPVLEGKDPDEPNYSMTEVRKKFMDVFSLLLSNDYPIEIDIFKLHTQEDIDSIDIYQQLVTIGFFYKSILALDSVPGNILLRIDHILAQLACEVVNIMHAVQKSAKKDYRINQGKSKKAKTKAEKKQPVLEEYYRIDKAGMKLHRIATSIKCNLEKRQRDVPSVNTIKRYLKEEKLI